MGCFASKSSETKASRISRWRSTGIVALRDSKLKTFPDEIIDLDRSVRTLDLTHNRIADIPLEISKLINMQRLVRKRPLNKKELAKNEEDIIETYSNSLTVHETKLN